MDLIITNAEELDVAIATLKRRQVEKKAELLNHVYEFKESIRPMNLLKSGLHKITEPGEIRNTLLKAAGGIGMGLLTKGIIGGGKTNVIGKLVTNTAKATLTNSIVNNADKIKAYAVAIYHNLLKK
jgi:hypothetical protein